MYVQIIPLPKIIKKGETKFMAEVKQRIPLALKYRPATWGQVVEQDAVKQILSTELMSGNLKRCMLFCGPAGCGKTSNARIFATEIEKNKSNIVEINCADNTGVDDMRRLVIEPSMVKPLVGQYKVFVLDECHMLTVQAQNALLKLLEEPPVHCVYILCTTDPQKVLSTIMSRAVRYDFQLISHQGIINRLNAILEAEKNDVNGIDVQSWEQEALDMLSDFSQGHMRNAIVNTEKILSFTNNITVADVEKVLGMTSYNVLFNILDSILNKAQGDLIYSLDTLVKSGMDLRMFVKNFLSFVLEVNKFVILRDINPQRTMDLIHLPQSFATRLSVYNNTHRASLKMILDKLVELNSSLKWETDVRPVLETNLLLMAV